MRRILGLCRNLKAAPDLDSSDDMPRDRKTNVEPTLFDLQTPAHYDQEEDDVRVPGKSSRRLPHPIEPYQPEPRYTMNTAVTPRTIIPTMYFRILGIEWNDHEQAHYYDIRSIPKFGEQEQPDLRRTIIEDDLTSFEEMGKRFHEPVPEDENLRELSNRSIRTTQNVAPHIEVGDEVSVRMNSTGEMDKCKWIAGKVVGMHAQYGLWECFIVSYNGGSRTMPCTERLLKLGKKGTQTGRKRFDLMETIRNAEPRRPRIRKLRPLLTKRVPEYQPPEYPIPPSGICFGGAGYLG